MNVDVRLLSDGEELREPIKEDNDAIVIALADDGSLVVRSSLSDAASTVEVLEILAQTIKGAL